MCLLWYTASRAGFILIPKFSPLNPELKRLFRVALPAILAGGLIQINLLVGRQVASYHEGGVAWLSYADRLYQLPLGVVGISIGIVLLPNLARKLANNDMQGSQDSFNRSLEFALALTLPAAIAIIVISEPLISVLYERGAFSQIDTANTSAALVIYAFGLPAFVGQKILQPIFYARENTRTPLYFALMAMIVNLVLAVGFSPVLGYLAPAIGTTIASWCMVILLSRGSRKYGLAVQIDHRNIKILPRIFLSAILMGLILYVTNIFFDMLPNDIINKYFRAIMLIVIGFLSYICIGQVVGGFKLKQLKNYFKN
jgi:putative peptidoglycan lipid II flippase